MPFSYTDAVSTLHELRRTGERRPELAVELGEELINGGYASRLGDEAWSVYEQILIAALDLGHNALAETCLKRLGQRFPNSARVRILAGMKLEAEGQLSEALALYTTVLAEDETNVQAERRRIAVHKARGQHQEAISCLVRYLDVYYNDAEAWLELAALYLQQHMYQQAGFCLEELLLLAPQNHLYHLKYAEVLYTSDNVPLALKEFCRVVELCEDYVRGLYGIKLCTARLLNSMTAGSSRSQQQHSPSPDSNTLWDLNLLATERLLDVYSKQGSSDELKRVLREWLQTPKERLETS